MTRPPGSEVIPSLYIPFYTPMKSIVERVGKAFAASDIVEVRGFPIRVFCLRNPDHIAQMFRDPPTGGRKYPRMMPRVKWVMGKGGYILPGGDDWREKRQKVQLAFKRSDLAAYVNRLPALVSDLLGKWKAAETSKQPFDVFKPMQLLITRANLLMFFSATYSDAELQTIQEETHFVDLNFVKPIPLSIPLPGNLRFKRYVHDLRRRMHTLVDHRRRGETTGADLLTHLLSLRHNESGAPWTDDEIVGEIFSVYFGASVMGTSLAWAFYLIASRPEVQAALRDEASRVLQGRDPTFDDLNAMPYAQGVLKEALRLYPPSWGYPRFSEKGLTLDGRTIPPRSLVIPMVYWTHRDPTLWTDPDRFRPERFSSEEAASHHPFAYLPFGAGPRTCLGAGLAPLVMQLILVMAFRKFEMAFAPRFDGDPIADFGFEIHPKDHVRVTLVRSIND